MWEPEPGWLALPGGSGVSPVGVWRTVLGARPVAVKRLAAPAEYDPAELTDPRHFAYWRRAADVATYGLVDRTPGLRAPRTSVEEDAGGLTIVQDRVEDAANSGLFAAHAMGRFAGAELGHVRWLARNQLRDRLTRVERRSTAQAGHLPVPICRRLLPRNLVLRPATTTKLYCVHGHHSPPAV